jgi:hypothetical protein
MDLVKQQGNVIKQLGSGLTAPFISDTINRVVDTVTGDAGKSQDEKIAALEAEVAAGKKTKQQAQAEVGMKKGGKVKASSASKRADGIAQRGKTRGRMI